MARAAAWLFCGALLLTRAAPAPPTRAHVKDSKVQEKTIVVRRMPNAYFYPFSLWPLPKFPNREGETSNVNFRYRRDAELRSLVFRIRRNER